MPRHSPSISVRVVPCGQHRAGERDEPQQVSPCVLRFAAAGAAAAAAANLTALGQTPREAPLPQADRQEKIRFLATANKTVDGGVVVYVHPMRRATTKAGAGWCCLCLTRLRNPLKSLCAVKTEGRKRGIYYFASSR